MPEMKRKATMENLRAMLSFVNDYAESLGVSAESLQQVELALEEVLVNIINYAYPDAVGEIEIQCSRDPERGLIIEIYDDGEPFDVLAKEDPDTSLALEEREIGGLGIFLVKKMMDETHYCREKNRNALTLVKRV